MAAERRSAVVLSRHRAVPPPGVSAAAFAEACLADTYEVVADLSAVHTAVSSASDLGDLLWPGSVQLPDLELDDLLEAIQAAELADLVTLIPADVPDLPGLVIAKAFQALERAAVSIAPELGGPGVAVLGLRLPRPSWWPTPGEVSLDQDPYSRLSDLAPRRNLVVHTPGWHRLRTPSAVARLDPGLEGWDQTRALLTGRPFGSGRAER